MSKKQSFFIITYKENTNEQNNSYMLLFGSLHYRTLKIFIICSTPFEERSFARREIAETPPARVGSLSVIQCGSTDVGFVQPMFVFCGCNF